MQPEWRKYEHQIFSKFCEEFPEQEITMNVSIPGYHSQVQRQVDVLVKGQMLGKDILGVIECKYFSRTVDVEVVDSFIGFMEDVGANVGIIITNEGFSKAAMNRADVKGIHLDIVEFNELEDYHFELKLCGECSGIFPVVDFHAVYSALGEGGKEHLFDIGHCEYCNSLHIGCRYCGAVTSIHDTRYGDLVECEGLCGVSYLITYQYDDDDHLPYEEIRVVLPDSEEGQDDDILSGVLLGPR